MKKSFLIVLSLGLAGLMALGLAGCVRPRPNPTTPAPTQLSLNPTAEGTVQVTATQAVTESAAPEEATATPPAPSEGEAEAPTAEPVESTPEPTVAVPPTEAPTAVPTAAPADPGTSGGTASASGSSYEVRWGDTLSGIARRFGTTIDAILAANPRITDRNHVNAGTVLAVPGSSSSGQPPADPPAASGQAIDYVIQYGDTLSGIARRYGTTVDAILSANPWITNRNFVPAGKHLAVTAGASSGGSGGGGPQSYTVGYGDTLTGIARRFNTTVWDIAVRNNIGNQNMIYAGQVLVIP